MQAIGCPAVQLYKQHFASEGGDDDEDDGDGMDGEGIADLAPSANKKRLVRLQAVGIPLSAPEAYTSASMLCGWRSLDHAKSILHEAIQGCR